MSNGKSYLSSDLEEICLESEQFLSDFRNKSVLVAGATGFIGSWLVATLEHMNLTRQANIEVVALSRRGNNRGAKTNATRHLLLDVGKNEFTHSDEFDCIFNAITPSSSQHGGLDPRQVLDASINGTENLLQLAARGSDTSFINLSSGIVTKRINDTELDLEQPRDAYLLGKRKAEELVMNAIDTGRVHAQNLRLYAFAGPGIPLDQHFAVGNFMFDAQNMEPIKINGNPETRRSYLYPTDLIINILSAATSPSREIMELGSTDVVTLRELAQMINIVTGNSGVIQSTSHGDSDGYFPIVNNLAICQKVSLEDAITRWSRWIKAD